MRGHLGTSGDIWRPFREQVGGASGSYNLQTISTDFLGTFCIILRPFWKVRLFGRAICSFLGGNLSQWEKLKSELNSGKP